MGVLAQSRRAARSAATARLASLSTAAALATVPVTATAATLVFASADGAAVVTEPLDVIRTRLMTQGGTQRPGAFAYEGLLHGLGTAVRTEGLYSLWKGLLPRLLTKSLGSVIWYTTYMEARRWYTSAAG